MTKDVIVVVQHDAMPKEKESLNISFSYIRTDAMPTMAIKRVRCTKEIRKGKNILQKM